MVGKLIYKCRLCGELHTPIGVPNIVEAMVSVVLDNPIPEEWGDKMWGTETKIKLMELHACDEKRIGLSVLVGAEPL